MITTLLTFVLGLSQFGASRTALATVADAVVAPSSISRRTTSWFVKPASRATFVSTRRRLPDCHRPGQRSGYRAGFRDDSRSGGTLHRAHRPPADRGGPGDSSRLIETFDDELAAVVQTLEKAVPSASGDGLFQAIVEAARAISENGSPFSAIVVVSSQPTRQR